MDVSGKCALVTGATDGVGRLVATRLGAAGARVLAHGRDRTRGATLVADIEAAGGQAEFLQADFADLADVRRLADLVRRRTDRLHILINNAGIGGAGPGGGTRQVSADGHELRLAVNYLAGFLLTDLLLPLLKDSAPARVVNVSSLAQQALDFDDLMLTGNYSGGRAYAQSKLAQVLFTIDLAEQLEGTGVTVNAVHPATLMATTMVRHLGMAPRSSVDEGAEAILQLAASPALEGRSGLYFEGLREARADPQAYDKAARQRLAAISRELRGLKG